MSRRSGIAALALASALASAFASALLGAAAPARAENPADVDAARELFREASKLTQEGRWEEARERYLRSLSLKRAAITLYSLGIAQRKTGHLADALEDFHAFLAEPSVPATAGYEQPARDAIAELDQQIARIAIHVEPRGAADLAVTVDGQLVPPAALAIPRLVDPGGHTVAATARGYGPAKAEVTAAPGSSVSVDLVLPPAPATPPPKAPPVKPAANTPGAGEAPPPPSRALPIALMAGGAAVLGAGVAVGLLGVKQASGAPTRDGPEADGARAKALAGDILGGAGIAGAAAGIIVLLVQRSPASAKPRAGAVQPWASGNAAGIAIRF
jgi:hypothetical protein